MKSYLASNTRIVARGKTSEGIGGHSVRSEAALPLDRGARTVELFAAWVVAVVEAATVVVAVTVGWGGGVALVEAAEFVI